MGATNLFVCVLTFSSGDLQMQHGFQIHQRRSIRLKGYDYSNPGAYFVTICVQDYILN